MQHATAAVVAVAGGVQSTVELMYAMSTQSTHTNVMFVAVRSIKT